MRVIANILKWLVFSLLALVSLVSLLALVIIQWPSLLVNPHSLEIGRRLADRSGIHVRWNQFDIATDSASFLAKRIHIAATGLCVSMDAPVLRSCFDDFRVSFAADLSGFMPKLKELGPIRIAGGDVYFEAPEAKPEDKKAPKKKGGSPLDFFRQAKINPVNIDIPRWRVLSGGKGYFGHLTLASGEEAGKAKIHLDSDARQAGQLAIAAVLDLNNPAGFWATGRWQGNARVDARLPKNTRAALRLAAHPLDVGAQKPSKAGPHYHYQYQLTAQYQERKRSARGGISGELSESMLKAKLDLTALSWIPSFARIHTAACQIGLKEAASSKGRLDLKCPVDVKLDVPPSPVKDIKIPSDVGFNLTAGLNTASFPPSPDQRVDGDVEVKIEPILTPLFQGSGGVKAKVAGVPSSFPNDFDLKTNLGLKLAIPDFRTLVKLLKGSEWAIPAPFHVLKGTVEFAANGESDLKGGKIPISLTTRLASKSQKLDIDAGGEVRILQVKPKPSVDVDFGVTLSHVQLQLPNLAKAAPPRLFPDSRIKSFSESPPPTAQAGQVERTASPVDYQVRVKTEQPVEILSNLARAPVPIHIHLGVNSGSAPGGTIEVGRFPLELFKRDAFVDHFRLELANPAENSRIDGAVKVKYTDYTVTLLILGSTGRPTVQMFSDPPLPQTQVISVLLFGRPMEELDPSQSESVGNTQAAIADSAIGLASLYVLAATPVESIGYDPTSGVVSAKVRLGEGTSLNLGTSTSGQLSNLGVRRRLSSHWTLETELARNSTLGTSVAATNNNNNQSVTTFLEWTNRY